MPIIREGANRLRCLGGGLRSWLGVRCIRTPALRPPGVRCRRGRAPRGSMRRFRQGARPKRTRCGTVREGNEVGADAAALECRDLREWTPGGRSHCAPTPSACCALRHPRNVACTGDPGRCGGGDEAACGAREEYPRRAGSDPTSGTRSERAQIASVAEGPPPRARVPGCRRPRNGARKCGARRRG
jgi:hypothetical protein